MKSVKEPKSIYRSGMNDVAMSETSASNVHSIGPAVSLFSGAAIGDKGLEAAGLNFVLFNEIDRDRAALIQLNYPGAKVVADDILRVESQIGEETKGLPGGQEIFAVLATPPCQGMSPNGLGKLLNNSRKGLRPKFDPRNRLILPALRIAAALKPKWVIFENVPRMENTVIEDEDEKVVRILDLVPRYLGKDYVGEAKVVEFADYGVPQRRQRLVTVYSRLPEARATLEAGCSLIPEPTHDRFGKFGRKKWLTVRDAIGDFPPLDAKTAESARSSEDAFHRVPVLDAKKYEWVRFTLENGSAFDNQCVNPACRFRENPVHGASRDSKGINRANHDTPLYCQKCGSLLPRPYTERRNGTLRIMRGYTSAYKRMSWDLPAPTLTQNLSYACSDHKLHPDQNRVLSLAEAFRIQTISNFQYKWGPLTLRGKVHERARDGLIRDVIGESVPPAFMYLLGKHVIALSLGDVPNHIREPRQLQLATSLSLE